MSCEKRSIKNVHIHPVHVGIQLKLGITCLIFCSTMLAKSLSSICGLRHLSFWEQNRLKLLALSPCTPVTNYIQSHVNKMFSSGSLLTNLTCLLTKIKHTLCLPLVKLLMNVMQSYNQLMLTNYEKSLQPVVTMLSLINFCNKQSTNNKKLNVSTLFTCTFIICMSLGR